jgi:hypothetical protein
MKKFINEIEVEANLKSIKNITLIGFIGKYKNTSSRVIVKCDIDGHEWTPTVWRLISGHGCIECAGKRKKSKEEVENIIAKSTKIKLVKWIDGYSNCHSKAEMICDIDGHKWIAEARELMRGHGCPKCGKSILVSKEERESQISKIPFTKFISWPDGFRNIKSRAEVLCEKCKNIKTATVGDLISGYGCPICNCAGFDKSKTGYLYLLKSKCGLFVKIGISNNYKKRHKCLQKSTPFEFDIISVRSGNGFSVFNAESKLLKNFDPVDFGVSFDGSTEWRNYSDDLLAQFNSININ